jgi:flagellar FliL protein
MSPEVVEVNVEEQKKSKLPLILGVLTLVILAGGVGYAVSIFTGPDKAAGDGGTSAATSSSSGSSDPTSNPLVVVSLDEFAVNLRESGGGRVLQMTVQVESTKLLEPKIIDRKAQIRDAILLLASDYSYNELEGMEGKMRLRDEVLVRINGVLSPDRVERVYFTQFLVQ